MLLLGIIYIVLMQCVRDTVPQDDQPFARLGTSFATMFALTTGINYFVQLTTVRIQLLGGTTAELEQFVMGNPTSAMASVNMLGWTFLLGLSLLSMAVALHTLPKAKTARAALLINAAVCIAGGVGFVMNNKPIIALCMYPLLGGAVIFTSVALAFLFRRRNKTETTGLCRGC